MTQQEAFRHTTAEDAEAMFEHHVEPVGEWVMEEGGSDVRLHRGFGTQAGLDVPLPLA